MTDSIITSHDALADAFALALKHPEGAIGLSTSEAAFIAQVHADYIPGELTGVAVSDLAANLADFWTYAAKRDGPGPQIRRVRARANDKTPLPW
jgi:hypothetical protein